MLETLMTQINESAEFLRRHFGAIPEALVVAGSGLSRFAETLDDTRRLSYGEIPHFPVSTVVGHAGELVRGRVASPSPLGGPEVMVMNGRKHLYEGIDAQAATLPLRALLRAGVRTVILSNAAGGLNVNFRPGDLMLITDHIQFQFRNPLIGSNLDSLGPRFPDMSRCWDSDLMALARRAALDEKIVLREGVYIGGTGPSYETRAEVEMLRVWADAVGMSTVAENLVAVHAGARCLGISLISNSLVLDPGAKTTHEEVLAAGVESAERFSRLVAAILRGMDQNLGQDAQATGNLGRDVQATCKSARDAQPVHNVHDVHPVHPVESSGTPSPKRRK